MAFTEEEQQLLLEKVENEFWKHRRPPLPLRDKIREAQRMKDQAIELYFERPHFRNKDEWIEHAIAKIRYVRTRDVWEIYWQRADLKWHRYPPSPEVPTFSAALEVIHRDECCCFFG